MRKVVFGLGNYGKEFYLTRHNTGFLLMDELIKIFKIKETKISREEEWDFYSKDFQDNEIFFVKPKCFMNESGKYIKIFMKKFKIEPENMIVIYDDISIELGKVKFKKKGSSGGHNGIKSIIEELKSENFCRIKIGIGLEKRENLKDWVLSSFNQEETSRVKNNDKKVYSILVEWLNDVY